MRVSFQDEALTPISIVGFDKWTKETLRSQQLLLSAPRFGLAATLSYASQVPPHSLCYGESIEVIYPEDPASSRTQKLPISRPHTLNHQVNLKARHPMVGHNWNHQ